MMRVAVTRALPGGEATAKRLRARGAEALTAPLLHIEPRAFDTDLAGAQAVLFTSANGVRAFAAATSERGRPALCVGDATAAAARAAGFASVASADGDVAALAALARARLDPGAGRLVHIAGAHVAGDVAAALAGFDVDRRVAYEAKMVATLPPAFRQPLDVVIFHSARAAEAFVAFGAPGASALRAACFSPAVARAASAAAWRALAVAPAPREDALLDVALQPLTEGAGADA